ncbi:hypothetical protein LCL95_14110 [Bacillus timonensis]|nr:hypothetical protein [Bacillus timonensis]
MMPGNGDGILFGKFAYDDSDLKAGSKINEDRYEVFVNDELIGHKTLSNPSDKLSDVDDFLKQQGFQSFSSSVEGDHYHIKADDQDRDDIEEAISVYLSNR